MINSYKDYGNETIVSKLSDENHYVAAGPR